MATYPLPRNTYHRKIGSSIWESIGNSPLLRLNNMKVEELGDIVIYAKAEWQNPGGSVKDRTAYNIISEAEQSGQLTTDKIILDASSGNTALAYAMIAAAKNYRITLCVPGNVSIELIKILEAYGSKVILTSAMDGADGAILKVQEIYSSNPGKYFYASQYENPADWRAHYISTGAVLTACLKLAQTLSYGRIVTIFPDGGRRYINESFWK